MCQAVEFGLSLEDGKPLEGHLGQGALDTSRAKSWEEPSFDPVDFGKKPQTAILTAEQGLFPVLFLPANYLRAHSSILGSPR